MCSCACMCITCSTILTKCISLNFKTASFQFYFYVFASILLGFVKTKIRPIVNTVPLNLVRQTLQFPFQNQWGQVEIDSLAHQLRADTYFPAPTPRQTTFHINNWTKKAAGLRFSQGLVKTASDVQTNKIGTIIP